MLAPRQEMEAVTTRLENVERQNRRMRWVVLGMLGLFAAALITAMGLPSGVQAPEFRVVDEHGQTRALLNGQGLTFADEEGKLLVSVAAL